MHFKQSHVTVEENASVWTENLVPFEKSIRRRGKIPIITDSLLNYCRIPKETIIIGRFNALAQESKSRKDRFRIIAQEVMKLWMKLNFPAITEKSVKRKIETLISRHDNFIKHPNDKDELKFFSTIFDITNNSGKWLSLEDKTLYRKQVESEGRLGYTTTKLVPLHPAKITKASSSQSFQSFYEFDCNSSTVESIDNDGTCDEMYEPPIPMKPVKRKCFSTANAVSLVKNTNLSTKKASNVCQQLSNDGIDLPTPSQSGIYRACLKESENMKCRMKETLNKEEWALHFDGKSMKGKERQVLVLKNEKREVRLTVLPLENSRACSIVSGIVETLNFFDLWSAIKLIICDTTAVNTGKRNGIISCLQRRFMSMNLPIPQYIGCQHHILDRILKHVMDALLGGETRAPHLNYYFVDEIVLNYATLKDQFLQCNNSQLKLSAIGWRDDMQFLFELCQSFRYYLENGEFPFIHFKSLPNRSNARWNSRAIFAILAFILISSERDRLLPICKFITGAWMDIWFSEQLYEPVLSAKLEDAVRNYPKAMTCFQTHWNREPSIINTHNHN